MTGRSLPEGEQSGSERTPRLKVAFGRRLGIGLAGAGLAALAVTAFAQSPEGKDLGWAYPVASAVINKPPAPPVEGERHLPGSSASYTQAQLDMMSFAVDWFPNKHPPMPKVVRDGAASGGFACGSCHLANGMGHPESAELAGLPAAYFVKTMAEFKSGARKDPIRMTAISQHVSDADSAEAAAYFAKLKPVSGWTTVVEAATVPKTYLGQGRMRFIDPDGGSEPIGQRIITVPKSVAQATARDPSSGFIAYVPPGSIARGKAIVTGASGKTPPCSTCHGPTLKGMTPAGMGVVPGIAGNHPIYVVRQLYDFQTGARNGPDAQLMKPVAAALNDADIVAVAAYVASLRR